MAQSQKNMREILVGTAVAAETTLKTFTASASTGELQILAKDGGAAAAGKPFVVVQKTADGVIISDVVDPLKIKSEAVKADAAEVQKVVTASSFPVPATAGEKYEYQVDIRLVNYGSLSVENFKLYHGHHILNQTGALTAESAVDALILNLNRNFSKEAGATATTNPLFAFSKGASSQELTVTTAPTVASNATVTVNGQAFVVALAATDTTEQTATKIAAAIDADAKYTATAVGAVVTIIAVGGEAITVTYAPGTTASAATVAAVGTSSVLVIQSKEQPLELGKKEGRPLEFDVTVRVSKVGDETGTFGIVQPTVAVTTAPFPGVGTGKQVANMEYFYRGERGDTFRGLNFPYNWPTTTKTLSDPSASYNLFEIRFSEVGDGLNQIELDKSIVIAITEALSTGVDALITRYNTFTGKSVATLGEV